jgi:hypothetical protein
MENSPQVSKLVQQASMMDGKVAVNSDALSHLVSLLASA